MATATQQKPNGSGEERARDGRSRQSRESGRGTREIGESVRALQRDGRELMSAVEQLSASASDALREQLDRRPYAVLGAGLAAGYVIGGGLSFRVISLLVAMAGRATVGQLLARSVRPLARGGGSA